MSGVLFVLRDPALTGLPSKGLVGRTPLEVSWLAEFVRLIAEGLEVSERHFLVAILWATGRKPRSPDDILSKLQRLGLAKPTRSKSVCVPESLTPLGHNVREYLIGGARP